MQNINWIYKLPDKTMRFLDMLSSNSKPGFFHYSLSGDIYNESVNWGLGNTVFATKIYYTLGKLDSISPAKKNSLSNFIKSFQDKNGFFSDPLIHKKALWLNIAFAIKHADFNNFNNHQTRIAETRQSISALTLLKSKPEIAFINFPQTKKDIRQYLKKLKWNNPWGAGSHFSHLLFFLQNSSLKDKDNLINFTISLVNTLQNPNDGCWYTGQTTIQQKINGAMKIITGLKAVNKLSFKYPKKIIDTCLNATNNSHACDNFNIIYVLKYANDLTNSKYRYAEIKNFCYNRLALYKQYYFPNIGGFSFQRQKANSIYYSAKITKGLNEPDIHGTVMFLWGIAIIAQILNINNKLKFKEFTT